MLSSAVKANAATTVLLNTYAHLVTLGNVTDTAAGASISTAAP